MSLKRLDTDHSALELNSALPNKKLIRCITVIIFAENQLSPHSIGISPLFTNHPRVLQQSRVRSST